MNPAATTSTAPLSGESTMTRRPILDPRTHTGLEQLEEALQELQAAIAWADRTEGDGNPVVFGRPVRWMETLLAAAIKNLTPQPVETLAVIVHNHNEQTRREILERQRELFNDALPARCRPAFANRALPDAAGHP